MSISASRLAACLAAAEHYRSEHNRLRQAAATLRADIESPAVALFLAEFLRPENLASDDEHLATLLEERAAAKRKAADAARRAKGGTSTHRGTANLPGRGHPPAPPAPLIPRPYGASLTQDEEEDPWTK